MAISRFLAFSKENLKINRGFTLIELVVVMGVVVIMSTILITYSRESGRQLLLTSTEAKILSLISRSKALSIQTFFEDSGGAPGSHRICAYGVGVDTSNGELFIFQDRVPIAVPDCSAANNIYDPGNDEKLTGELNQVILNTDIMSMTGNTDLREITYIPPDPEVRINGGLAFSANIEIQLNDGSRDFLITVDRFGQIQAD